ncbi:MAG: NAD(P)H-dependent glycerol-3-phosphate dehydrogenase [Gammaproteobacteria bacterium]
MSATQEPIAVLGGGSWGTALAVLLARNGQSTRLWDRDPTQIAAMRSARRNERFLPGTVFPAELQVTSDLTEALAQARDVLVVVPSCAFRSVVAAAEKQLRNGMRIAWGTKGFEPGTGQLLHQVIANLIGEHVPTAVVSGPTFAREVARGLPTAVTLAATNSEFAVQLAARLHSRRFRVYTSEDIIGVQVGGAVKNVLAVAAGIADGLGFGANTRAALITRGLAELTRLGVALGGQAGTFSGLAGLGDLVLTCTDDQSRNRRLGLALGRGSSVEAAQAHIGQVVEGVAAAPVVISLARRHGVEMPICTEVNRVLRGVRTPRAAVDSLLARDIKPELG